MKPACTRYCCSKFLNFKDDIVTGESNLSNDIHPIFRPENFTGFDRSVMEVPLRLATMLIESPPMVPFLNTLFFPDLSDEKGLPRWWEVLDVQFQGERGAYVRYAISAREGQDQIDDWTKVVAGATLQDFANLVSFEVQDFSANGNAASHGERVGMCTRSKAQLSGETKKIFPRGRKSLIAVSNKVYDKVARLTNEQETTASTIDRERISVQLMLARFDLVTTLIHELGHALCNAACGHCPVEPFYCNDTFNEMGHALEKHLFGGQHHAYRPFVTVPCHSATRGPRDLVRLQMDLPSHGTELIYSSDPRYHTRGTPTPPYTVEWRIPLSYYQSLFTTEYWEKVNCSDKVNALHPPHIAGWVFVSPAPGQLVQAEVDVQTFHTGARIRLSSIQKMAR